MKPVTQQRIIQSLVELREDWYIAAPSSEVRHVPECALFPDELILAVTNRILDLDSLDKTRRAVLSCRFMVGRSEALHEHLQSLRQRFFKKGRRPRQQAAQVADDDSGSDAEDSMSDSTSGFESGDANMAVEPATSAVSLDRAKEPQPQPLVDISNLAASGNVSGRLTTRSMTRSKRAAGSPVPASSSAAKRPRTAVDGENAPIELPTRPRRTVTSTRRK
ncbi:hypothetical protein EXIGLDRAFT_702034 [Exidia glandulosa HHB12029]|uniref:Uncharacterized protein n=1 Tax=Exidia glandulosa HHB12029 TaxID=1314781 RepID=A0A165CS08_EXIGL|nr:hypothetical protein EXIGLDRAFT_702034 [Exidia glandulosa HHB12029]